MIDGTDGRAHHVRFRGIDSFAHAPPIGGIVEVRRFGSADEERPTLILANRSDIDLARQVTAPGATWLDHRLVERQPMPLNDYTPRTASAPSRCGRTTIARRSRTPS